jgi:uncharacterized protein YyaL (SSP411 family)
VQNRGVTSAPSGRSANRLAKESSPYLRQHAGNPVDWYPWGEEAFAKAKREDRPVFLSIGYSSCHWCHVMERESFENEEIARVLNDRFVAVKVDREERPDVDDVYMTCVQLTTGQGGWPLSAFLLPDGRPFFGGTYFPPEDRHGRPGFRTILLRLSEAFRGRRADVEDLAARLAADIDASQRLTSGRERLPLGPEAAGVLSGALASSFDPVHGGFAGAPKFPPHLALAWWLRQGAAGDAEALGRAAKTLEAMALGGIHDHLGGGFHRYSTDERWLLPHFEKMLTDNAQLLGLYAGAWAVTGSELFRRTARSVGDYLLREMRGPEGGFFAATDADSEGEEGRFFVFTADEIRRCLGDGDAAFFLDRYGIRDEGNFHDEASGRRTGANVLFLSRTPAPEDEARLAPLREALLSLRSRRVPPGLDDKRIAGWVALAVSGFARSGRLLGEPRYLEAARSAARFLRTWKEGEAKIPAFLEDEAYLAHALLDLSEAEEGGRADHFLAGAKASVAGFARFRRKDGPGLAFTGEGHEALLTRGRDLFDKAIPSASGSAAFAQARLARKTGDAALALEAAEALSDVSWLLARSPHGTESWHFALAELLEFDGEHPGEGIGDLLALRQTGVSLETSEEDLSSKGNGAEGRGGAASGETVQAESADGLLSVSVPSKHRAKRGDRLTLPLSFSVADGWYLPEADGIRIEAWGGSDFTFEETLPRPNAAVAGESAALSTFAGSFEARLSSSVSRSAARGPRTISVVVTYRACGEGVCRPEAALSFSFPVVLT